MMMMMMMMMMNRNMEGGSGNSFLGSLSHSFRSKGTNKDPKLNEVGGGVAVLSWPKVVAQQIKAFS